MKDYTDINLLLDRSGSMELIRDDTIGGINQFVETQKQLPGTATFSMFQFDDTFDVKIQNTPLNDVPTFTRNDLVPRGWTALLDAMARTINHVGNRLSLLNEQDRPNKVLVAVVTDGQENDSKEFNKKQVFDMVNHQKTKYGWEFVYIGANQDAISVGQSMGIASGSCLNYEATSGGIKLMAESLNAYTGNYRAGKDSYFSDGSN